jgi:hypothetical protein
MALATGFAWTTLFLMHPRLAPSAQNAVCQSFEEGLSGPT